MIDAVDQLISDNPAWRAEQIVCPHLAGGATRNYIRSQVMVLVQMTSSA
jgi:hypothetical protein